VLFDPKIPEIPVPQMCLEEPLYFSYFVVHKDSSIQKVSELNDSLLYGINGAESLSGCHSIRIWLHQTKRNHEDYTFFQTGGHAKTLALISEGKLDCGAIDVVCLMRLAKENLAVWSKIRILSDTMLGPHPAQPITISADDDRIDALLRGFREVKSETMAKAFVSRFEPISSGTYDALMKLFQDIKHIKLRIYDASLLHEFANIWAN